MSIELLSSSFIMNVSFQVISVWLLFEIAVLNIWAPHITTHYIFSCWGFFISNIDLRIFKEIEADVSVLTTDFFSLSLANRSLVLAFEGDLGGFESNLLLSLESTLLLISHIASLCSLFSLLIISSII